MNNLQARLLRLHQVKESTGLSKSSIYARISEGSFPKQILLGSRLVVWVESDIQKWITEQVSAANQDLAPGQGAAVPGECSSATGNPARDEKKGVTRGQSKRVTNH